MLIKSVAPPPPPFRSEVYKRVENKRGGFSIHSISLLMLFCVCLLYLFSFYLTLILMLLPWNAWEAGLWQCLECELLYALIPLESVFRDLSYLWYFGDGVSWSPGWPWTLLDPPVPHPKCWDYRPKPLLPVYEVVGLNLGFHYAQQSLY